MTSVNQDIQWHAHDPYVPSNASKTGLLEETRQFLLAYERTRDLAETRRRLIDGGLAQRSRSTRVTIVRIIQERLTRWKPPAWVLDDLASFAADADPGALKATLLLHTARQDRLLYDLVQQVIAPRWHNGERAIIRADVQRFLDDTLPEHPEIEGWNYETREKLAGNLLTILRDYGLLHGTQHKQIVEPIVPLEVVRHLIRLLQEEGLTPAELTHHPDWRLWLWDAQRVEAALAAAQAGEAAS